MNAHVSAASLSSAMPVAALGGVCNHSSPAHYGEYVIFCVGNNLAREAAFRQWALVRGMGFKSLKGSYEGVTENSFIVNARHLADIKPWTVQEESILHLGPMERGDRSATLVYGDGRPPVSLGRFVQVSRDHAMAQQAWTFDPSDNSFWVCK